MPHMFMKIAFRIAVFAALSMQPAVADDMGAEATVDALRELLQP